MQNVFADHPEITKCAWKLNVLTPYHETNETNIYTERKLIVIVDVALESGIANINISISVSHFDA